MSDSKIISIVPAPKFFSITWMLGSRCNYDCMYCPSEWHDKTSAHHDLSMLKNLWNQILERTQHLGLAYKVSFTGGEVTTNKNFLPFLQWIRQGQHPVKFFLTTNGSASLGFYRRLARCVDGISLSTHSEYIDERRFFTIAKELDQIMIRPDKSLHVNIMDEHWAQDRIKLYQQFCEQHGISHSVNRIDYTKQTRTMTWMQGKYNIDSI